MHVGLLQARLHIGDARSLKAKRQVVKSVLDRMRHRYAVAAAEVDDQDHHKIATVAFAAVSGTASHAEEVVRKILEALRHHPAASLIDHELEVL